MRRGICMRNILPLPLREGAGTLPYPLAKRVSIGCARYRGAVAAAACAACSTSCGFASGAPAPSFTAPSGLRHSDGRHDDRRHAGLLHVELIGHLGRQVDHTAVDIRSTILDLHQGRFAVLLVCHLRDRAERQALAGGGIRVGVEAVSVGHLPIGEMMRVVRRAPLLCAPRMVDAATRCHRRKLRQLLGLLPGRRRVGRRCGGERGRCPEQHEAGQANPTMRCHGALTQRGRFGLRCTPGCAAARRRVIGACGRPGRPRMTLHARPGRQMTGDRRRAVRPPRCPPPRLSRLDC